MSVGWRPGRPMTTVRSLRARRGLSLRPLRRFLRGSGHRIAAAVGISRYTVAEYLRRAAVVGITLPVPLELDDAALERKLFTPPGFIAAETTRPHPRLQPPENHALVGEEPRHLRRNAHPRKQSRDSTWILAQSIIDPYQRFVEGVELGG
jgi:transcriptional regulator with XRE-family HTH domain